jgi:flagellar basal-body rod modification protein FlgD
MNVTALSPGISSGQSEVQTKKRGSLNQEDFLNIFVAQMRYQNPLEPLDNYQIASQMAQFSSLEALQQMGQSLQNVSAYQASMNSLQATALIGKKVEAAGKGLSLAGGAASEGSYQLSKPGNVTVKIYDASGALVRTLEEGTTDTNRQRVVWDGKNQAGAALPDGTYSFEVSALDEKGQSISSSSWMIGTVTGISFENGITYLRMGTSNITISDITSILG